MLALDLFAERHPEVDIHLYGRVRGPAAVPATDHGLLTPEQLNALYNRCVAGLVLSATNVSLVPHEMLAAGCIPVVNDAEHNRIVLDNEHVAYAPPTPFELADGAVGAGRAAPRRARRRRRGGRGERERDVVGRRRPPGRAHRPRGRGRGRAPGRSQREPAQRQRHRPLLPLRGGTRGLRRKRPAQEGVDVRVLILDDCSPDDTPEVGRASPPATRGSSTAATANQGLIETANEGLEWADGDTSCCSRPTTSSSPARSQRATAIMERPPTSAWSTAARCSLTPATAAAAARTLGGADVWRAAWIRRRCRTAHNCISSPEAVVRTSVHRAVGGYDPACFHTSDLNMWLRIAAVSDIAYVRGTPQAIYRVHPGSMLRSQDGPMVDLHERRRRSTRSSRRTGARLAGELRGWQSRALARQALWQASRAYDRDLVDGPDALPVDELVAFAFDVYPDARRLREWHGFRCGAGSAPGARSGSPRSSPPAPPTGSAALPAGCAGS